MSPYLFPGLAAESLVDFTCFVCKRNDKSSYYKPQYRRSWLRFFSL